MNDPFQADKFGMSRSRQAALACNAITMFHFLYGVQGGYKRYVSPELKRKKKREKIARKSFYRALRQGKITRQ